MAKNCLDFFYFFFLLRVEKKSLSFQMSYSKVTSQAEHAETSSDRALSGCYGHNPLNRKKNAQQMQGCKQLQRYIGNRRDPVVCPLIYCLPAQTPLNIRALKLSAFTAD
jgi:hypothetical protein